MFSTGFSSGEYGGKASRLMLSGTMRAPPGRCQPAPSSPAFGDQLQRQGRSEAVDLRQVHAENAVKGCTHIERGGVDLLPSGPRLRERRNGPRRFDRQRRDRGLQSEVTENNDRDFRFR